MLSFFMGYIFLCCPLQAPLGPAALLPDVLPRPARLAARGGVRRRRPPLRGPLHRLRRRRQRVLGRKVRLTTGRAGERVR